MKQCIIIFKCSYFGCIVQLFFNIFFYLRLFLLEEAIALLELLFQLGCLGEDLFYFWLDCWGVYQFGQRLLVGFQLVQLRTEIIFLCHQLLNSCLNPPKLHFLPGNQIPKLLILNLQFLIFLFNMCNIFPNPRNKLLFLYCK